MGKRRRLSERQQVILRKAVRDGYKSYRYGAAQPVTLPRIFTGQKRKSMVDKAMDVLRDWRLSPFEYEGPARAGIRSALVLDGHGWHRADTEAAELIAEGLHIMGAKRPSEEQAKPEYVIPPENCKYCGGTLDKEDFTNGRKFCSTDCAKRYLRTRDDEAGVRADTVRLHAWYIVNTTKLPKQICEACGETFQPTREGTRTCSRDCAGKIRKDARPDKECKGCGKTFHGERGVSFCSIRCVHEYNRRTLPPRSCEVCGTEFRPAKAKGKYCSRACGKRAAYLRERARQVPKACAVCSETFQPRRPEQKYCSGACYNEAQKAKRKASDFLCEEVAVPFLEAAE